MEILVLECIGEDSDGYGKYELKYKTGDIHDEDNYIADQVEGYPMEFDYKGLTFQEDFITEALTYYFDKQYYSANLISFKELKEMFDAHMESEYNKMTKIKRICIEYAIQKLKENEFE